MGKPSLQGQEDELSDGRLSVHLKGQGKPALREAGGVEDAKGLVELAPALAVLGLKGRLRERAAAV
jgi:hypothetical protein